MLELFFFSIMKYPPSKVAKVFPKSESSELMQVVNKFDVATAWELHQFYISEIGYQKIGRLFKSVDVNTFVIDKTKLSTAFTSLLFASDAILDQDEISRKSNVSISSLKEFVQLVADFAATEYPFFESHPAPNTPNPKSPTTFAEFLYAVYDSIIEKSIRDSGATEFMVVPYDLTYLQLRVYLGK